MPQVEPKPQHRLKLLRELYKTVLNNTESFEEGAISADLAYLMGAVLSGSYCDWDAERPLMQLLRENFPGRHSVWRFIHIERLQGDRACSQALSFRELATFLAALRHWQDSVIGLVATDYVKVASDGGNLNPLSGDDIDQLYERLNCGNLSTVQPKRDIAVAKTPPNNARQ